MKIKRPSVKGMKNVSYLGRFQKDKFIQDGHNTSDEDIRRIFNALDKASAVRDSESEGKEAGSPILEPSEEELFQIKEEEEQDRINDENKKSSGGATQNSRPSERYEFESTIKNGKRSHRLIRR